MSDYNSKSYYCILNSGASESNNTIMKIIREPDQTILCSNIEHSSVLNLVKCQCANQYKIINVDTDGILKWKTIQ